MQVEFVVGSLLCSEKFSSGYYGFHLSSKTSISKFQFDQESGRRRTTLWMCYLQIIIYLFFFFFFLFKMIGFGRPPVVSLGGTRWAMSISRRTQSSVVSIADSLGFGSGIPKSLTLNE